jgi:diaminopimelate epimerase
MNTKNIQYRFMHGAGNIFCVIDNRVSMLSISELAQFIVEDIPINWTVDGLIAIRKSDVFDFEVDFLNPDGSHGPMCGNGARCAVRYYVQEIMEPVQNSGAVSFMMAGITYQAEYVSYGHIVTVHFKNSPSIKSVALPIEHDLHGFYVENGSDHLIIDAKQFMNSEQEFEEFDLDAFAKPLRRLAIFPRGVNVNLVYPKENGVLRIRTFERGVERETAACGTGSLAAGFTYVSESDSSFISDKNHVYPKSIQVKSGSILTIDTLLHGGLSLSGPAEFLSEDEAYEMYLHNNVGLT